MLLLPKWYYCILSKQLQLTSIYLSCFCASLVQFEIMSWRHTNKCTYHQIVVWFTVISQKPQMWVYFEKCRAKFLFCHWWSAQSTLKWLDTWTPWNCSCVVFISRGLLALNHCYECLFGNLQQLRGRICLWLTGLVKAHWPHVLLKSCKKTPQPCDP